MPARTSAGLLLYRRRNATVEVFLVHPGGPLWAKKDDGTWSIPKGEYEPGEDAFAAAVREFREETGFTVQGGGRPLTPRKQPGGKVITVWALEGDVDAAAIRSNTFTLEWPPRSGRRRHFPEVDRAGWFDLATAHRKILPGQRPFLDQLAAALTSPTSPHH